MFLAAWPTGDKREPLPAAASPSGETVGDRAKGSDLEHKRASAIAIGRGDLHAAGSDTALYAVRRAFLDALLQVAPQTLADLRALSPLSDDEAKPKICKWAMKYRLAHNGRPPRWLTNTAALTLMQFSIRPDLAQWCHMGCSDWSLLSDDQIRISIRTHWDPTEESRETALGRITSNLTARMDEIALAAQMNGGRVTGYKREPEHFAWLARYLANGDAPKTLSAMTSPIAVKQALRETAALIGLSLPPFPVTGSRGRPAINKKRSLSRS